MLEQGQLQSWAQWLSEFNKEEENLTISQLISEIKEGIKQKKSPQQNQSRIADGPKQSSTNIANKNSSFSEVLQRNSVNKAYANLSYITRLSYENSNKKPPPLLII